MELPILVAIPTFNRLEMTRACWDSILQTTEPGEVSVVFVDNGSTDGTVDWLYSLREGGDASEYGKRLGSTIHLPHNVGTARAINRVWEKRLPGQACLKMDNDAVIMTRGWVPRMLSIFDLVPTIGLVGLKRRELIERCPHPAEKIQPERFYRSYLYELSNHEIIEVANHVLGTVTLYAPKLLDRIGDLYQMQDQGNVYGFDDALSCLRAKLVGLQSCFLRGIKLEHIDPGEGGPGATPETGRFTREKLKMSGDWIGRYDQVVKELELGLRTPYWKDSLD